MPDSNSLDHFFRGAFSVDIVLLTFHARKLKVLLQSKNDVPFQGEPGLPGKLILPNEDTDRAMDDLLVSTIGRSDFYKKQLKTFSDLGRHPLGRIITFAYYGLLPYQRLGKGPSEGLQWCDISKLPDLVLDHNQIVKEVQRRFQKGLLRHPIVFNVLPKKFIIPEIIAVYEQAFGQKLDAPNFRKEILGSGLVSPLGEYRKSGKKVGRPAELYTLTSNKEKVFSKDKIHFNFSVA